MDPVRLTPDRVFNCYRYIMEEQTTLVSVEEYLHTDYSPDCDYVEGVLEDRNVGLRTHGVAQVRVLRFLVNLERQLDALVLIAVRVRIGPTRFRVPDVSVLLHDNSEEEIVTTPPFLCVEILCPEDRMSRMEIKIRDYLDLGVRYVWVIDPYSRNAWTYTSEGRIEITDGVMRTKDPNIEMPLSEILQ